MRKIRALVLLLAIMVSSSVLWAQSYDVVTGEESTSVYFKIYQEDTKKGVPAHAEVVPGEYQYSGIVTIPDFVTWTDDKEYPVTVISEKCFANCKKLQQVILGNKVEEIKKYAFYFSSDASGVKQDDNVKNGVIVNLDAPALRKIAENAFYVTTLSPEDKILRIGKNVSSLGDENTTFMGWCTANVEKIEVEEGNTSYVVDKDGVLYDKDKTKVIMYPKLAPAKSYTTPATVKRVLSHSIYAPTLNSFTDGGGIEYLGSVDLGTNSISFGKKLKSISEFYRLTSRTKLKLSFDAENPYYQVLIDDNGNRAIYGLSEGVPVTLYKAFNQNGNKNKQPDYNMDGNFGTETLILPTTVTTIAQYAFLNCEYLKYVDCQNSTVLKASGISDNAAPAPASIKYINIKLYSEREGEEGIEYVENDKGELVKLVNWSNNAEVVNYVMPETVTAIAGSGIHDNNKVKTFDIGPNLSVGGNDGYFWRFSNLEKFTDLRGNNKGLFVEGDALYYNNNGTISMVAYPSGKKDMTYTVADGTKYLSGNTGTPAVRTFQNKYLRAVDLGDDMVEIRYRALKDMTKLEVVRISAPVAPIASSGSFEGTASATTKKILCVPSELKRIYETNAVFSTCFEVIADKELYDDYVRNVVVEYTIKHYRQNLQDDDYTEIGSQSGVEGKLLSKTNAAAYEYIVKGYKVANVEDFDLDEDGIVANIYYDRETYKVKWMNGETVVSEATERYETPLTVPTEIEIPAGKNLIGWNSKPEATVGLSFENAKYVENITYYALFADNATVKYTVKHLLQNLDDDNYTEDASAETEGEGIWGLQTQASAKTYPGYTAQAIEQKTIAEDGTTVVEVKYNRNNYTVSWMNGGTLLAKETKRYEAALTAPAYPTAPAGKHYIGWNTDEDAQTAITLPEIYDISATYYLIAVDNATVEYTVQHKLQNIESSDYDLKESDRGTGIAGTQTTAKAKEYTGFTAQAFAQKAISEDGSTVVEILYNRDSYDIVWKNSDETITSQHIVYGAAISVPAAPVAPAGKHFVGWNTDKNAVDGMNLSGVTVEGPTTYYAIILDNATVEYTVIHKTEKLDGTYEEKVTATGKGIFGLKTNVVAATYEGFTAQNIDQAEIKEDGSTVVEVLYTRNSYTLAYENLEGATIKNASEYTKAGTLKYEEGIVIPTLEREGYTYSWKGIVPTQMPSDDVTLSVEWKKNVYIAHWDFNNGNGDKLDSPNKYGEPINKPDGIPQKEWYEFIGWAHQDTPYDVIEDGNYGNMPATDVYFVAVFAPADVAYKVAHKFETLDGSDYVEEVGMAENKTTKYNATSEAQAKEVEGYTSLAISQKTINGNGIVVEVYYKRNQYNLTWVNLRPEAIKVNEGLYTESGYIKVGTPIVAPIFSLEGATYTWSGVVPDEMPSHDVQLSVVWEIDETTAIETIDAEEATISVKGKTIVVTVPSEQEVRVVNMAGQVLFNEKVENQATITLDAKGVYIVATPSLTRRVLIR